MRNTRRNELARLLATIDQDLALAEEMVAEPQDNDDLQSAEEFVVEFQETRRQVEAELNQLQ